MSRRSGSGPRDRHQLECEKEESGWKQGEKVWKEGDKKGWGEGGRCQREISCLLDKSKSKLNNEPRSNVVLGKALWECDCVSIEYSASM